MIVSTKRSATVLSISNNFKSIQKSQITKLIDKMETYIKQFLILLYMTRHYTYEK